LQVIVMGKANGLMRAITLSHVLAGTGPSFLSYIDRLWDGVAASLAASHNDCRDTGLKQRGPKNSSRLWRPASR